MPRRKAGRSGRAVTESRPRPDGRASPECRPCAAPARAWYRERLSLVVFALLGVLAAHVALSSAGSQLLLPFWQGFYDYVSLIWWAVLLGFLAGGFIDHFIPSEYIQKYLSLHRKRSIIYAVAFGFLASACSHGILAIAIELYRKGASTPSVIAFLLASPWANLPITILFFGFFGLKAFLIILAAVAIALVTGFMFQALDRRCWVECHSPGGHGVHREPIGAFSIRRDVRRRLTGYSPTARNLSRDIRAVLSGSWSLGRAILWWLLIGMAMAAFARGYVPSGLFTAYLAPTLLGLATTLIIGTIIEVCSEGSSPLAFEIYARTGAFGNAFGFLMTGVSTDYTELGLVASTIGRRAALFIPLITVPQILLLGWLFNTFL
jgi:uncharacterized membrane protein YraQ (UPF0718 family)